MNLLWQIVQDDSKVEQSIADAALSQLCKVVSAYNLRIHRNMLIQIFCDHIRNRVSVHQSIVLLQKVLRTQSFSFRVCAFFFHMALIDRGFSLCRGALSRRQRDEDHKGHR